MTQATTMLEEATSIPAVQSLLAALALHAAHDPAQVAYIDALGSITYGQLHTEVRRGAAWLARQGVGPRQTVALALSDAPDSARGAMIMLYAIAQAGAAVLPLYPNVPQANWIELIGRYGAQWVLAGGVPAQVGGARGIDAAGFDPRDAALDAAYLDGALPMPAAADPFVYIFTSGTTGAPKSLLATHGEICGKALPITRHLGANRHDRMIVSMPWPSPAGLRYMVRMHQLGGAYVALEVEEPLQACAASLARHGVTRMLISPWQMRRLILSAPPGLARPMLSGLRALCVVGAPLAPAELEAARATLTPWVYAEYGTIEIGVATVIPFGENVPPGCVGTPLPGTEIRVDDPQGKPLPAGQVGELGFRTAAMCHAYAGNPQATAERFRNGWFYPGDAGYLDAQGRLFLRGRLNEVINYGGIKVWPDDIEPVLKSHPMIADAAIAGVPDPLAAQLPVAYYVPRGPVSERELRAYCAQRIDGARLPVFWVQLEAIPRNQNGKVLRDELVARFPPPRP